MTEQLKVRYNGRRVAGVTDAALQQSLAELGFTQAQIDSLVAGRAATIKRRLDAAQAEAYRQRLERAGLLVDIVSDADEAASSQSAEPETVIAPEAPVASGPARFDAAEPTRTIATERPATRRLEPVQFTGNGGEFFGIWIVNIFLMILTLGFYAPWAKVRTNQYFYGHTQIDGASFQYLADPWVIFRGRLVAIVAVAIWAVVSNVWPLGSLVLMALFLIALPWIVVRSLKFHAVNSAYRNIRFDFRGGYAGACMAMVVWPIVAVLSLLLAAPLSLFKSHAFMINNSYFGTMPFRLKATAGDYYVFFLRIMLVALGFAVLAAVLGTLAHPVLAGVVGAVGYLVLFGYFMASLTNLVMNSTTLGMHGFESNLGKRRMVWIFLTNSLLIGLTLGFYTPWAKVRMAAYRASCTEVAVHGDLDSFVASEVRNTSALGQEIGDAFDVGISIV